MGKRPSHHGYVPGVTENPSMCRSRLWFTRMPAIPDVPECGPPESICDRGRLFTSTPFTRNESLSAPTTTETVFVDFPLASIALTAGFAVQSTILCTVESFARWLMRYFPSWRTTKYR